MYSDHITWQAVQQPHALAVSLPGKEVSYRQLESNINAVAHHLRPLLEPGSRVAVVIDEAYVHWLVLLALARLGHVSASVPERDRDDRAALVSPDAVVTRDESWWPTGAARHVLTDRWLGEALASPDPGRVPERPRPHDPARIITSSGTTGTRKLMQLSHEAVVRRMQRSFFGQFGRFDDRVVIMMGMGTSAGFGVPLRTWLFGGALCLMNPSPKNLLRRRVTGLVVSPADLRSLVDAWPEGFPRIPNLTITVGGGALSKEAGTAARLKVTPDLIMVYGSTETSTAAVAPVSLQDRDPSATGIVLPWVDLQVVDEADRPLPDGREGQIRIRADAGIDGYLGDPDTSARVFRAGFFYPGDIGSVSGGILRIAGRADDVMNLGGKKVLPDWAEARLAECRGVADIAVFSAYGAEGVEEPWCALVVRADFDRPRFDAMARRSLRLKVKLLIVKQIPRNEMGKAERPRLRDMVRRALARA